MTVCSLVGMYEYFGVTDYSQPHHHSENGVTLILQITVFLPNVCSCLVGDTLSKYDNSVTTV